MGLAIKADKLQKRFYAKTQKPGLAQSLLSLIRPKYREVDAVCGIDLTIETGEIVGFIGPNGAGKSTTIKMLTGILHPTAGRAEVLGYIPWRDRKKLAYNISTVFGQRSQLWYHLPPSDTFELLSRIYSIDTYVYKKRLGLLTELFEIGPFLHTSVRKLSLGERIRCEIAGALLHNPQIVFLDEPTIGLDIVAKQKVREYLRHLNTSEGTTIFLTSHNADDIEQLCKRVIIISEGILIFDDSVTALRNTFAKEKIVKVKLLDDECRFELPGVETTHNENYSLTLKVDLKVRSLETVISHLVTNYRVADMTILEPPLEQVIATIYESTKSVFRQPSVERALS